MPELSALAVKYGHPVGGEHDDLYGSSKLKSGLTPLNLGPFDTLADVENLKRWKMYQKQRFEGKGEHSSRFTTNELEALESLAPMFEGGSNPILDNVSIHPLFVRENWNLKLGKHQAPYPLRRGREGFWLASNDAVWEAIVPALKLVSKFLANGHAWPWLDALVSGRQEVILPRDIPSEPHFLSKRFKRFKLRHPRLAQQDDERAKVQDKLISIAKTLKLGFMSGHNLPQNGLPDEDSVFLGKTMFNPNSYEKARMVVALEVVEPLLRMDLTPTERSIDTFRLASILAHETVHVLWIEQDPIGAKGNAYVDEPFFEDEVISELGFSFQNALFGGIPMEFVSMSNPTTEFGCPSGGIWKSDWNVVTYADYSPFVPTLLNPPYKFYRRDRWPIPAGFFLDVCQQLFWDTHVRKFGSESTKMGPLTDGSRKTYPPLGDDKSRIFLNHPLPKPVLVDYELSDEDKKALDFENERRIRARRIRDQLRVFSQTSRAIKDQQWEAILHGPGSQPTPQLRPERPSCARFDEIRNYLSDNRSQFALDTLNFRMPEHVMYAHILRRGGIQLTADEWRSFLEVCHLRKLLFTHDKIGTGFLERNHIGWPTTTLPSRPRWPKPDRKLRDHFIEVSKAAIEEKHDVFCDGYLDHDKDLFRQLCRNNVANWSDRRLIRISEFEPVLFESLLYWCDQGNRMFTYGPEGIIRLLKEDGAPKPKTGFKRRCPQM